MGDESSLPSLAIFGVSPSCRVAMSQLIGGISALTTGHSKKARRRRCKVHEFAGAHFLDKPCVRL